jgi:HPt (histidine-containing phosphotransfer) domain-containing protein
MAESDPAITALVEEARSDFGRSLQAKAATLEDLVARGAWVDARRASHKLRGSAGVYGFVALGAAAAALDDLMSSAGEKPDAKALAGIRDALGELRSEADLASRDARDTQEAT